VVAFVGFTGYTLVMPFLSLYVRELGVTNDAEVALWTGLALGATPAITAACAPFWGRIGDRFGNKILVQRSLLSFIFVMIAMAYVTRAWQLVALRALQGVVAGYGGVTISMVALSVPRERMTHAIGLVQTAQRMGPAVGPIIGGILARVVGMRASFFAASAIYLVAFTLLTVMYREPRRDSAVKLTGDGRVTFGNILAFENFLLLMCVIFGLQLVDRSFGPILPLHLERLGYGDRVSIVSGVLFSVLAVSGALGHGLAASLLRRMSARVAIAAAAVAGAVGLAAFAAGATLWLLVPSMALVGLGIGTALTAAFSAAGSVIPPDVHGVSFGFLTSASLIGSAASPVLSGLVVGHSFRVVFVAGAVTLGVLALAVRRVMVERDLQIEATPVVEE
jgi:DHA1 family multidrug resistance protein-like MFS transporter